MYRYDGESSVPDSRGGPDHQRLLRHENRLASQTKNKQKTLKKAGKFSQNILYTSYSQRKQISFYRVDESVS